MTRKRANPRKRDHKKEYRRKKQLQELRDQDLAPPPKRRNEAEDYERLKTTIKRRVRADARKTFKKVFVGDTSNVPKRHGEYDPGEYEETLEQARKKRYTSRYDWTDEKEFIASMLTLGLTARDSYTMWFSP